MTTAIRTICPRCDTALRVNYDEPLCLQCGYVDYSYVADVERRERKSPLSQGTRYVLRYVGSYPYLADTLCHVKQIGTKNSFRYAVNCPFCRKPMHQTSLSGKRRDLRQERYKCAQDHRVSLTPCKDGSLGWA